MAYDGWIEFGGVELVNLSRTAQLAAVMGLSPVQTDPSTVQWIETLLGGTGYDDVTQAPWYDAGYPASAEFAGLVPLSFPGLGDSTLTAEITEYVNDGGTTTRPRNSTLSIVASVVILASTDRGAEYGKRWMDRVLAGPGRGILCTGTDMRYFRYVDDAAPIAHHRDVRTTRGSSITRKARRDCSVLWFSTFTFTAGDPFEYGEPVEVISVMSSAGTTGPNITETGSSTGGWAYGSQYDYAPVFDPAYPALVPGPVVPNFYPAGWNISDGDLFYRFFARVGPVEPGEMNVVPKITMFSDNDIRLVRICIWPGDEPDSSQDDPLFSTVVTYAPAGYNFIIDGEAKMSYVWVGENYYRRADSLVFDQEAKPVNWSAFDTKGGLLVTMDFLGAYDGIEMNLMLVPRSQ